MVDGEFERVRGVMAILDACAWPGVAGPLHLYFRFGIIANTHSVAEIAQLESSQFGASHPDLSCVSIDT